MYHFSTDFKTINCLLKEVLQFKTKRFKPFSNINAHKYPRNSLKLHFNKSAEKLNAMLALTIGENELAKGVVNIKSMATREEKQVPLLEVYSDFNKIFNEITLQE